MPITHDDQGRARTITGAAINGFRGVLVLMSIKMYLESNGRMRSTRNATPGNMRRFATEYTGRTYARSRKGLQQAYADLQRLAEGKSLDELGETHAVNALVGGTASDL